MFTPSFTGLTIEEAEELAEAKKLKITIIDSVYESYSKPGTVIDQTPKPNLMIKKGRNIFLTIKARGQKIVSMPDLIYGSLIQARSLIESNSLRIGNITYRPSKFNDCVIEQLVDGEIIYAGDKLPAGSRIDLIVGSQNGGNAVVPDLVGLSQSEAEFKAAEYSLNIGETIFDESVITSEDSVKAVIWKQSVKRNSSVSPGTSIDLWLSTEPEQYQVIDDDI